jgi:hypothetical protein
MARRRSDGLFGQNAPEILRAARGDSPLAARGDFLFVFFFIDARAARFVFWCYLWRAPLSYRAGPPRGRCARLARPGRARSDGRALALTARMP